MICYYIFLIILIKIICLNLVSILLYQLILDYYLPKTDVSILLILTFLHILVLGTYLVSCILDPVLFSLTC